MMLKVSSSAALGVLVERVCHPGDYDPEAQEQAMLLLARMFHGESARRQLTRKAFFQGELSPYVPCTARLSAPA